MSTETWDYMAQAATDYLAVVASDEERAADPTPFGLPIAYLLNKTASESAVEFARLVEERVPEQHARMAVQLAPAHHYAMLAAREIIPHDYDEWRTEQGFREAFPGAHRDGQ